MQLFRARCSGAPVPKKLIKEKNLFILCDLMHRWKNLTQSNRSWSLINNVLVSFCTSASRHLQFFQVSASSSFVVLILQLQWCIGPESVKKTIIFLFLVHLFFTVSWSQVHLNDYLSSLTAVALWGALDCPLVSWASWERKLGTRCAAVGGLHPHNLITSQSPYHPIPSHLALEIQNINFGGIKTSKSSK